jgi:hypothetical protein
MILPAFNQRVSNYPKKTNKENKEISEWNEKQQTMN